MITVNITINRDTRECSLLVKGHAGQAEQGQDIVCAAASILAYTAAQRIKDIEREGHLTRPAVIIMTEGDAIVSCQAKDDETFEDVLHTMLVVQTGYSLLVHNYPQYVGLKIVD